MLKIVAAAGTAPQIMTTPDKIQNWFFDLHQNEIINTQCSAEWLTLMSFNPTEHSIPAFYPILQLSTQTQIYSLSSCDLSAWWNVQDLSRIVTNTLFVWLDQEWRDVLSYTSNPIRIIRLIVMKSVIPFSPQGIAYPIFAWSSRKTSNQTDDMWFSCIYHSIWCFTTGSEFEAKPYFPNLNLYSEFLLVIEMVLCRTGSKTNTSTKKTQPC